MLVLVAGVAGALYLGGKVDVADPTVSTNQAAPGAAQPAAPAATGSAERDDRTQLDVGRGATLAEDFNSVLGLDTEAAEAPAEEVAPEPSPRRTRSVDVGGKEAKKGEVRADPVTTAKPKPAPKNDVPANTRGGSVSGTAGSGGLIDADDESVMEGEAKPAVKPEVRAPAKKSPPPAAEPTSPPPPPADQAPAPSQEKDKSRADAPATLHNRAVLAAADGECDAVLSLAAQIRKADSTYYDKAVRTDKRLARCLSAPAKK
jgi:hypothetical protein